MCFAKCENPKCNPQYSINHARQVHNVTCETCSEGVWQSFDPVKVGIVDSKKLIADWESLIVGKNQKEAL